MRKYFYLIIILFFSILYIVTLLVDIQGLFYTHLEEIPDSIRFNGIPVQVAIFVYGLTGIVSIYYLVETLFYQFENIKYRLLKSFSLIISVYFINWIISLIINSRGWTIYEHYRGAPAIYYCFLTLFFSGVMFVIIELLNRKNGFGFIKRMLTKHENSG